MNLQQLQQIASSEQMIPDAPVVSSRTLDIDAALKKVWLIQTDVAKWPEWYSYLDGAAIDGPFTRGTKFVYGGVFKHHLQIAKVRDHELVMTYGKYVGFSGVTKWEFSSLSANTTRITFTESSAGFMMGSLYSSEKLAEHLDAWLAHLKKRAEDR